MNALEIIKLSKSYGCFRAVRSVSLSVKKGEIFGFLGMNGAGKTTTLKMTVGLLKPDTGDVLIDGTSILSTPLKCKEKLGYIPDRPYMYPKLTASEFLAFVGDLYSLPREKSRKKAEKLLEVFGLGDKTNYVLESFSHGMKQRVAIVAGLLHDPQLLVIDEPMVGLDPVGAKMLKSSLRDYAAKGNSVFISTHSLDVAQDICDRLAIIHNGEIIASGTFDELRSSTNPDASRLEELFLKITQEEQ